MAYLYKRLKGRTRHKLAEGATRSIHIDRDKLNGADKRAVGTAMVKLFATIQKLPREVQLLSLAASFVLQSEALGFDTNDAYTAVTNLMKDPLTSSGRATQFDAMKWHIQEELSPDATDSTV